MEKISVFINRGKKKCLEYQKYFWALLGVYLLAFSALFRANFGYVDDLGRTFAGYHGWLDWSRWSTQILATLVHADWYLTDVSPLPQIMACVFMAGGGIIILNLLKGVREINVWSLLAVSLTALTPYFLGIISYKFDSPYMALSFLVSVIPFLFRKRSKKAYVIVSSICLLMMCTTYQASSGIYPMIAFFLCMQDIHMGGEEKKSLHMLVISGLTYLASLGVFWLFFMRENGVSVFSFSQLIPDTVKRYVSYYQMIFSDFNRNWIILIIIIILLFLAVFYDTAKGNRITALVRGVITVFVSSFLCFGAYLFISEEAYDVRAMFGFNVFVSLLAVFISFHCGNWLPKIVYTFLAWSFLVFALTHGNALAQQQNYINYRVGLVAGDLNSLEVMNTDEKKKIQVIGDIGLAPVNMNMAKTYPMLKRTVFTGFSEGFWGEYYLLNYFNLPCAESTLDEDIDMDLPVLKDTMYHIIRGNGDYIVIELK